MAEMLMQRGLSSDSDMLQLDKERERKSCSLSVSLAGLWTIIGVVETCSNYAELTTLSVLCSEYVRFNFLNLLLCVVVVVW